MNGGSFELIQNLSSIFMVVFLIFFVLIFSMVIYTFIKNARKAASIRKAPRIKVPAVVVSKRSAVRRNNNSSMNLMSYFVTFEFESGDRLELSSEGEDFGLLSEGDRGIVTFQGTLLISFERETSAGQSPFYGSNSF